jgi:hypothetical protein
MAAKITLYLSAKNKPPDTVQSLTANLASRGSIWTNSVCFFRNFLSCTDAEDEDEEARG